MSNKFLGSDIARRMILQGKPLLHLSIEEIDISNLIIEKDVKIINCKIRNLSAENTVFEGSFELIQSDCGDSLLVNKNEGNKTNTNAPGVTRKCSFSKATFHKNASIEATTFVCPIDFSNTNFEQGVCLKNSYFKNETSFINAAFDKIPSFERVKFDDEVNFSDVDFGHEVVFRDAHFSGLSDFTDAKFGSAEFEDCQFHHNTVFRHVVFRDWADFSRANFRGELIFTESNFKNGADFSEAQFNRLAKFEKAIFNQDCYFTEATFNQLADFDSITFIAGADFRKCIFKERIEFRNATINDGSFVGIQCQKLVLLSNIRSKRLNFQQAHFFDKLDFTNASIEGEIRFDLAIFYKEVKFDNSQIGQAFFKHSQFQENCSFRSVTFIEDSAFQKTVFKGETDLRDSVFKGNVDFYDAQFNHRVYFRNVDFQKMANFRSVNIAEKADFTYAQFQKYLCFEDLMAEDIILNWRQVKGTLVNHQQKKFFRAMREYGLLKNLFEKQNNYNDMDKAYRMFKRMERKSAKVTLKQPAKMINKLFNFIMLDLGSGYGTCPLNVALTTIIIIVLFGIFYSFFSEQIIIDASGLSPIKNLAFCIYFSFLSFVTLGAENLHPDYGGWLKYVVAAQAFIGFFLMTLFVVTFTRKVIR